MTILVEQLKTPIVKRISALLEQALSPIASSFHYYQTELWKHYVEARDNNKFIQTLLRYFKVTVNILIIIYFNSHNSVKMLRQSFLDVVKSVWNILENVQYKLQILQIVKLFMNCNLKIKITNKFLFLNF